MKYIILTTSLLFLFVSNIRSQTPNNDLNWQSYFIEDFSAPIDWNKWQLPSGNWQPTREYYTSNNVLVNGGVCNFLIDKFQTGKYHIGGLETKNTSFPYGYYEIKWQVPISVGRWVSWWLCCGASSGNSWEELDFYENSDIRDNSIFYSNIHSVGLNCDFPSSVNRVSNDMTQSQNIIGVEWTPHCLIYYYNNVPVKEIFYNDCIPCAAQYRLFITPGLSPWVDPDLTIPSNTTVDYVKVWTLKKDLIQTSISNNSQLSSFVYNLKKTISIDASVNSITIPVGQKSTFRATDLISIVGDFTVPLGAELILFTHNEPDN